MNKKSWWREELGRTRHVSIVFYIIHIHYFSLLHIQVVMGSQAQIIGQIMCDENDDLCKSWDLGCYWFKKIIIIFKSQVLHRIPKIWIFWKRSKKDLKKRNMYETFFSQIIFIKPFIELHIFIYFYLNRQKPRKYW